MSHLLYMGVYMERVYEFLKRAETWYLATVDENGHPQVRPFGAQNIYEGRLYIETGLKKQVAKQMLAHPRISISGMVGEKWIRLDADAVYDERLEAQAAMLEANPNLKTMYAVGDGNTAVFYLKNAKASICCVNKEPEIIEFG